MTQRRSGGAVVAMAVLGVLLVVLVGTAALTAGVRLRGVAPEPPAQGAGPLDVALSPDAARHPSGSAVQAQLLYHFEGINTRDYQEWRSTVVDARAAQLPEARWREVYRSTIDGSIWIDRIDDTSEGTLLVRLRFISTQDVADAPDDAKAQRVCWTSTLPMEGAPPRIGMTQGDNSVPNAC